MTTRCPLRYGSTSRGGITFCIGIPCSTGQAGSAPWDTPLPGVRLLCSQEGSHTGNIVSTASGYWHRTAPGPALGPAPDVHDLSASLLPESLARGWPDHTGS